MTMPLRRPEYPKPRLTGGGKQRREYVTDAPPALHALALSIVPPSVRGPAGRGAFARGWCDSVRGRKADENPYRRGGSGWQHGMASLYTDGWRAGRQVLYVETNTELQEANWKRLAEQRDRVMAILRGEIVSPKRAVGRNKAKVTP